MSKKQRVTEEDIVLWQRVARDVKPLKSRHETDHFVAVFGAEVTPGMVSKSRKPEQKNTVSGSLLKTSKRQPAVVPVPPKVPPKPVDLRHGETAGLDGGTHRRLFRGDVPINRRLDLHGLTAARAQTRLESFIQQAAFDGCRCVLIITGKGTGILRRHVPGWLKRAPLSPLVLALAEARPGDGGSGAFYVLLRRHRNGTSR